MSETLNTYSPYRIQGNEEAVRRLNEKNKGILEFPSKIVGKNDQGLIIRAYMTVGQKEVVERCGFDFI